MRNPSGSIVPGSRLRATAMTTTATACAAVYAALLLQALPAAAAWPERPIRMIVPQAIGSATDNVARIVATEMAREIGQQIVVDNRPGGALQLGLELTVQAPADGYTIAYAPIGALAIAPHLMAKPPVDAVRDLGPVAQTVTGHHVIMAGPKTPFMTLQDVIGYAKKNPGKLFNASSSNGSPGHIGFELLKSMAGINVVHVPYKGGAAALVDLMGGQVQLMMEGLNSATPHVKAGRVRGLAVTGPKRSPLFPDIPTVAEAGVPDYVVTVWHGVVAPVKTPRATIGVLNAMVNKAITSPEGTRRILALGSEPYPGTPEDFWRLVRSDRERWGEVIRRAGAKMD
ncbi:MAG: tripartite tricarboxylate transporter substrate binding protein [Burkholderiales bacterium]|nr:tripartite tricarboxylate transporter substrate binding protein [Burkholderiales bacterium]